jgi:ribonuclease P protein component
VQRRHRLSRSRDFEAVYRHGTSVSSRYLVLHSFPRTDEAAAPPRLGLAVPKSVGSAVVRNRVKRLLREVWRGMLDEIPPGRDFVLSARPGLAELIEARGQDWLEGEVSGVLERARS